MMIDIDVWVRGTNDAVTVQASGVKADAASWTDADVRALLTEMLGSLARAKDAGSDTPVVALRGFSWIVSPDAAGVLLHIELQSGTASAGPFNISEGALTDLIMRVMAGPVQSTLVH